MSLKVKLISFITTFILLCSLLVVGVFAVKNTTFNVGGNIAFNVQGIEATITRGECAGFTADKTIGNEAGNILRDITIDNNMSAQDIEDAFAPWSGLNLAFSENVATIKLTITNTAKEGADNYIDITAIATATTKNNAEVSVVNDAGGSSALLAPKESASFTITFAVIDDEYSASLESFLINFNMQKKVLADFPSYNADSRITITCDTTARTASVTGNRNNITEAGTHIEIPKYVKKDNVVYVVRSIGERAFWCCESLTSITIPDTVTSIGDLAFFSSGLTGELVIPSGVTSLGDSIFSGCSGLTGELVIPSGVTSLGDSIFSGCSGLTGKLVIPDSVTSIGSKAFSHCGGLTGELVIPSGVTSIGINTFNSCSGLTGKLVIPDSVTSIGANAFRGCSNLASITIPGSVTSMESRIFYECTNLTSATISNGVTSIVDDTFSGCSSLTSVTIPDSVTSIGNGAFRSCSNLASITIPGSVTSIAERAFEYCSKLATVNYRGTQEQWDAITIGSNNEKLTNATKVYNYAG